MPARLRCAVFAVFYLLSFVFAVAGHAQDTPDKIDVRPYAPHDGSSMESVSLTNGSLVMNAPLWSFHQRGKLKLDFSITYDSPNYDFFYECDYIGAPSLPATVGNTSADTATNQVFGDDDVDLSTAQPQATPIANPCHFPFCGLVADSACRSYWDLSQEFTDDWATWRNSGNIGIRITSSTDYAVLPVISVLTSSQTNPYQQNVYYGYYFNLKTPDGGTHSLARTLQGDYRTIDGAGFRYQESTCTLTDNEGTNYQFSCSKAPPTDDPIYMPAYYPAELLSIEDTNGNRMTVGTDGWTDSEGRFIPLPPNPMMDGSVPAGILPGCPSGTTNSVAWQLPGVPAPIEICVTGVTVNTHIQWPKYTDPTVKQATEVSGTFPMISGIVLPSGDVWKYSYTPNPDDSLYGTGYNYGNLSQITLPTGGTVNYDWAVNHATCGSNSRTVRSSVTKRTLQSDVNAAPSSWKYGYSESIFNTSPPGTVATQVTDSLGNMDVHTLSWQGPCTYFETAVDHYDNQSHLLRSETTDFQVLPVIPILPFLPSVTNAVLPIKKRTIWPDGKSQATAYVYDQGYLGDDNSTWVPYGNKIEEDEYDFATGATNGTLLRKQTTSYWIDGTQPGAPTSPLTWNLLRQPSQVTTTDMATGKAEITHYGYDETPLVSGNASAPFWDSAPANGVVRGNQTSISKYLDSANTSLTTSVGYTDTGMIASIALPLNTPYPDTTTNYSYSPAFQGALVTQTTNSLGQTTLFDYYPQTLLPHTVTDANQAKTTYIFYPDTRLQSVLRADGGETDYAYPSPTEVDSSTKQSASVSVTHRDLYDGLGRKVQSILTGGCASGDITTETTYDPLDRPLSETNPHCSAATAPTDGTTVHGSSLTANDGYDALGRPLVLTHPDGTQQSWSYLDTATTFTDESRSSSWTRTTDALGRLTQVLEPGGLPTSYGYDAFGDLLSVNQQGNGTETPRQRSFTYDSLSRLLTSTNPETGTICYGQSSGGTCTGGYDAHGNLLHKTDANGSTVSYSYDALNRMKSKLAPDAGNTNFYYYYDQGQNGIGRLTQEDNPNGTAGTMFSYDALGRIAGTQYFRVDNQTWVPGMTGLQYDLAGNLTQLTYPDGRALTQTYDGAGRLASVADGASSTPYFSAPLYFPSGTLSSATYGNGITQTWGLNNRLQPCAESASQTGATTPLFQRQIFYAATPEANCGAAANNNGNIAYVLEGPTLGTSQTFQYDNLNRLLSAYSTSRPAATSYNQSYNYDSFGNMLPADHLNTTPNFRIDNATNRLTLNNTDYGYDNAGQLVGTPGHGMWYTAEGYLRSIDNYQTGSYLYDGMGERTLAVHNNTSWNEYAYLNGQPMADMDNNGHWTDNIYANGQKIARVQAAAAVLHLSGVCGNCNGGASNYILSGLAAGVTGYTLQPGDKLVFRQKQDGPAQAGMYFYATDGTNSMNNLFDSQGYTINAFGDDSNTWQTRTVDLSVWQGKQLGGGQGMSVESNTAPGIAWDSWIADVTLVGADGEVRPLFTGQQLSGTPWNGSAGSSFAMAADSSPAINTHYYLADQLGTTQMELSSSGNVLWQGAFTPFGQEIVNGYAPNYLGPQPPDGTANRYKFTGKERDTESGLDYFGARYYGSNIGRFMSPDWSAQASPVPYATMGDPQSLNLYSYVGNNPLSRADADGHFGDYYLANAVGTNDAKYVGSDGINDGAVHVLAPGSTVTYSPDHSIIDLSQTSAPVADFSRAEGVAMHDAVSRSNAPNATDTTGGAHEEGFATTKGVITAAPAGPTFKPGDDHASITVPTTADTTLKVHVHPEGSGNAAFNQQPSTVDKDNVDPLNRPNMTSVVVGAGSGKVQTYNGQGVTATIPLKDFPKQ